MCQYRLGMVPPCVWATRRKFQYLTREPIRHRHSHRLYAYYLEKYPLLTRSGEMVTIAALCCNMHIVYDRMMLFYYEVISWVEVTLHSG